MSQNRIDEQSVGNETYGFDAIRGIQAGHEFYVVMCELSEITKLFSSTESEIPPELRAQRILRKTRIPTLKNYILNKPNYLLLNYYI